MGGLFCRCLWVVYRAVVVRAYRGRGADALAVDDDCGPRGGAWRDWLGVGAFGDRFDLAEVAALDGSGPLLFSAPPSVLDLDEIGTGCDLAVYMDRDLGLKAFSVEALCGI
jgi:hypothetical protein